MNQPTTSQSFSCPKCLGTVSATPDQAGEWISCSNCQSKLRVPESVAAADNFDDLFDSPPQRKPVAKTAPTPPNIRPHRPAEPKARKPESPAQPEEELDPLQELPTEGAEQPKPQADAKTEERQDGETNDPFEFNESASLKIDGITDLPDLADAFYHRCPVCDSTIQSRTFQIGQSIRCTDCHSDFEVKRPEQKTEKLDPWRRPARVRSKEEDELSLADPIDRPKVEYRIEEGFGLGEVEGDLLAPLPPQDEMETANPVKQTRDAESREESSIRTGKKPIRGRMPESSRSARTRKAGPTANAADRVRTTTDLKLIPDVGFLQDSDLLIRTIVTVVFLAMFYVLTDSIWAVMSRENLNGGEKFNQIVPALLGAMACGPIAIWFLAVTFSVLMRAAANRLEQIEEWPGFGFSEWIGGLAVVAFGLWVAMLPGVLAGFMAMKVTGWFVLLPIFAAISTFALAPPVLISSFYNESVFNIFSAEVFQTFTEPTVGWATAYRLFALAAGTFLLGILITLIPGLLFSFLGAAVQVLAITALAVLVGRHASNVVAALLRRQAG